MSGFLSYGSYIIPISSRLVSRSRWRGSFWINESMIWLHFAFAVLARVIPTLNATALYSNWAILSQVALDCIYHQLTVRQRVQRIGVDKPCELSVVLNMCVSHRVRSRTAWEIHHAND